MNLDMIKEFIRTIKRLVATVDKAVELWLSMLLHVAAVVSGAAESAGATLRTLKTDVIGCISGGVG